MPSLSQIRSWYEKNLPFGTILPHGAATAPTGWLLCDGSAVSRTTYASLFSIIGVSFGPGDGSTTFNLPDSRGLFLRGAGSQTVSAISYDGGTLGTKRKDRTNNTGLSASTSSTNSASVGTYNAAHTHSWTDRYYTGTVAQHASYSDPDFDPVLTGYSNTEVGRTTGNPNVSLNHGHNIVTNTVSSSSSFNAEDVNTVPGYLTTAFIIKV